MDMFFVGKHPPVIMILLVVVVVFLTDSISAALLRTGKPIPWQASKNFLNAIRQEGARQFLSHYNRCKRIETPGFAWGDEIEFGILRKDCASGFTDLSLNAGTTSKAALQSTASLTYVQHSKPNTTPALQVNTDISHIMGDSNGLIKVLSTQEDVGATITGNDCEWQPEYGSWMIEAVPLRPFQSNTINDLLNVEKSMQLRRKRLHSALSANEIAPTVSAFPMMGVPGYPHTKANDAITNPNDSPSDSSYVSDALINEHPRFAALTRNIRLRRGSKVNIVVPADKHPDGPASATSPRCVTTCDPKPSEREPIHMDAMAFGMGCCCLQVTMQAHNEAESRFLHDQLAILAPILHALSAATPIFKGRLAATDTRWNVISQSVDDRTSAERRTDSVVDEVSLESSKDAHMVGDGVRRLAQSRYSEVPLFIARADSAEETAALSALNDVEVAVDEEVFRVLHTEGGIDDSLSRHIAHLFTRDPLVIFDDSVPVVSNPNSLEQFENIQSTNWRSMRWKTPALEVGLKHAERGANHNTDGETSELVASTVEEPGWRVEFRPLDIQLTDFENAAFAILVVLLSRCILSQSHNLYLPMSYVHENMRRAQLKDAVLTQKFWFRKNGLGAASGQNKAFSIPQQEDIELVEMSLDEIMNGQKSVSGEDGTPFAGLLPQVAQFVRTHLLPTAAKTVPTVVDSNRHTSSQPTAISEDAQCGLALLRPYIDLIRDRAAGRLPTTARWLRDQVTHHPAYVPQSGAVTPQIANDLLQCCEDVGMGRTPCPELNGRLRVDNLDLVPEIALILPNFSGGSSEQCIDAFPCSVPSVASVSKNTTCVYKCV